MYEARMRLIQKEFMIWIRKFHPSEQDLSEEHTKDMDTFGNDVSPENSEALPVVYLHKSMFQCYLNNFRFSNGTGSQFWI